MSSPPSSKSASLSHAQAARWLARQEEDGAAHEAALRRWLAAEPENADVMRRGEKILSLFDGEDAAPGQIDALAALRAEAKALRSAPQQRASYPWAWPAIAASIVVMIGLSALMATRLGVSGPPGEANRDMAVVAPIKPQLTAARDQDALASATGEQRILTLSDGSRITMNADTSLTVDYDRARRIIRLARGQALFDVAHDASRPFTVIARGRTVTALGTIFEVDARNRGLAVTLVRGSVRIDPIAAAGAVVAESVKLVPGQQFVAGATTPQLVQQVDVGRTLLWRDSMIYFDNAPLSQVVEELARYNRKPIRIASDDVGALRLSGVFRTNDQAGFASMVETMLPVRARENERGEIALEHQP